MRKELDKPTVENSANGLGARIPPDPHLDIQPDGNGWVSPATGGMSVASRWTNLPPHRIPIRLLPIFPAARGGSDLYCWKMGEGPFYDAPVAAGLILHVSEVSAKHGTVEPEAPCSLNLYIEALAQTRDYWVVDEELVK